MSKTKTLKKAITNLLIPLLILSTLGVINVSVIETPIVNATDITEPSSGIMVNTTGYWPAGGSFTTSGTPISAAINYASDDANITVTAGIYNERLVIDKQLTLAGSGTTTIIQPTDAPTAGVYDVEIDANGTTIQNFLFDFSGADDTRGGQGIVVGDMNEPPVMNVQILNNTIYTGDGSGVGGTGVQTGKNCDVSGLLIQGNTFYGDATGMGEGVYVNPYTGTGDVTICYNDFCGYLYSGVSIEASNVNVSNNVINSNSSKGVYGVRFIDLNQTEGKTYDGVTISNNTIQNVQYGIRVGTSSDKGSNLTATIHYNTITNNDVGIWVRYGAYLTDSAHYNNIADNTDYGINNAASERSVNAAFNWWGHASGPYHNNTNLMGLGDKVTDNVTYSPWLGDVSVTTPRTYHVNPTGTIQEAIDEAGSGDTILVLGGTYNENVTVTKGLNLTAASGAKIVGGVWIKDIHTFTNPITVQNFIIENGTSIDATHDYGIKISGDIGAGADQPIVDMHILNNTFINCGKTDDVTTEMWWNAAVFFDSNHFGALGSRYDTIFAGTGEISNNTIINNLGDTAKRTQLGIGVRSGRNMKINHNTISGNVAEGIHHWGPVNTTSIGNYEIDHNYIDLTGWIGDPVGNNPRGIWSYAPQSSISHNTVISKWIGMVLTYWDDTYWGGGTAGNLALTVSHNVIHPPTSGNMSVGLRISGNNSQIMSNEIYGASNNVTGYGVGLLFEGWGYPEWGERTECSNNTFTGNYIHDNYDGIWTWAPPYNNAFDNEFHYNNIENNINSGMTNNNNDTMVNAKQNWWGDASGPNHAWWNPMGTGDAVSDYVDFTPWLSEEYALMVNITYPTEGAYIDSVSVIWINGTITETNWMGQYPQINDTSFALDLTSWNGTHFAFFNVTALGDSTHSYRVNFTDLADNTASDTVMFTLDTIYPVVDITHPTEDYYFDSEVVIWINGTFTEKNFDVSGLAINGTFTYVTHTWNSTTYEGTFAFKNSSALTEGTHHIKVSLTDKAGKTGNATVTFTVDTVPPVVDITYPEDEAYLDSVAVIWINGTITELNMGALEPAINDTSFDLAYCNSTTGVFAFQNNSAIPDCTHYYKVNFTDLAGKTGYDTVYFTIDTTEPLVEITTPTDGHHFDSESVIWINGTFTEKNLKLTEPLVINHTGFILANWTWDSTTYEGAFAFCNNTMILDGDYTVMVSLTDLVGKTGFDMVHFHIDTTYPVVDITFPSDDYYFDSESVIWINGTFTEENFNTTRLLDINHTGFALADWTWNSATYEGTFALWNTTALTDDTYHIKVSTTDLAGKTGYDTVYFTIDTVPPVVDIAHPTNGQYLNTVWINGTVTELNIGGLEPHINDTAFSLVSWDPLTGTFAFKNNTAISDDTIFLTVNFTDLAGKTGGDTVYCILETTLPIVNITYPTEGAYLNVPSLWVNGTVTESNTGSLKPSINDTRFILPYWNSTTGEFAFNNNTVVSDGLISLVVSFTDLAGNTGSDSVTFTLDTTAPAVAITYPTEGSYISVSSYHWINGTVTELNMGGLEPAINDTRFDLTHWDSVTGNFAFKNNTAISDGLVSAEASFTDLAGNTGEDTVSFTLDTTAPTEPTNFAVTVVEDNATFTWMASTDNLILRGYYLELNGEIRYVGNVTGYTWLGLSPGGFTAWLWATDMAENNSTKTTLTTVAPQFHVDPPTIECQTPAYAETFVINVSLSNVDDFYGFEFKLYWNMTLLECVESTVLPPWVPYYIGRDQINNTAGMYWGAATGLGNATAFKGNTTLVTLTFQIRYEPIYPQNSSCLFELRDTMILDSEANYVSHTVNNGEYLLYSTNPRLEVQPSFYRSKRLGDTFDVNITVVDVVDLYTFDFEFMYNATLLEVTGVTIGPFLNEPRSIVKLSTDNVAGVVSLSVKSLAPAPPASGDGTIAIITFKVIHAIPWQEDVVPLECALSFNFTQLVTDMQVTIPHVKTDGLYRFDPLPGDLTMDAVVGLDDLYIVSYAFGTTAGDQYWNPLADVDKNGIVNIRDLTLIAMNYGIEDW